MGKFDERKKDVYYHIARIIIEEILTKNIMGMRLGSKEEQLLKRMYVTNEYSEISDLYDKVISKLVDKREIINAHMYNSKSFEELVRRAVKMSVCREDSFKITDLMMETIGSKRETYDKLIACISSLESLLKKSSSITRATEEVVEHHVEEETKSATNYVNNSSSRVIKTEKEKNKLHGGFDFFDREKRQLEKDAKKQELVEEKKSDKEIILPEEQETKKEVPEKKKK